MRRFLLRRLLQLIPTFFGITLVTFALIHLAPGDPALARGDLARPAELSKASLEGFRQAMGLDRPLPVQYAIWLERLSTLDFGVSARDGRPVLEKIEEALPRTALLAGLALLVVCLVALPLGVHAAVCRGSVGERVATALLFVLHALPSFWVAILLIELVGGGTAWGLDLLPFQGLVGEHFARLGPMAKVLDLARHLVLPVVCLAYGSLASLSRQVCGGLNEALVQDYVRAARAKGLPELAIVLKHGLRNGLLPALTLLGTLVPNLLGGSVIVEMIFGIRGVGMLSFESIASRDYNAIMGLAVVAALCTMLANLATDLLYAVVDPRIGHGAHP